MAYTIDKEGQIKDLTNASIHELNKIRPLYATVAGAAHAHGVQVTAISHISKIPLYDARVALSIPASERCNLPVVGYSIEYEVEFSEGQFHYPPLKRQFRQPAHDEY